MHVCIAVLSARWNSHKVWELHVSNLISQSEKNFFQYSFLAFLVLIIIFHVISANVKPFLDGVGTLYTVVGQSINITAFAYDVNRDNVTIMMLSPVNVTSDTLPGNVSFAYIYTPPDMTPYAVE